MFNRLLLKVALFVCASVPVISYGLTEAQAVRVHKSTTTPNFISAQTQNDSSRAGSQPEPAQRRVPKSIKVSLIRQDFSDCVNSNVTHESGSYHQAGGSISVTKNDYDGKLEVKVSLKNGTPNTKYNVFLKCKQQIGNLYTNSRGVGTANLSAPLNIVPSVFAFDMYPDGAPSGNKYQSVQVKF